MLEFKGVTKSEGLDSPLRHYKFFISFYPNLTCHPFADNGRHVTIHKNCTIRHEYN
jgi:hypothetical protein